MVETISPVVHGGRNRSYWTSIALHVLGATTTAALFGALLGGLGALLGAPWGRAGLILIALAAGLYLAREGFGLPIAIPDRHRQVPDWWRTFYSKPVAAFLYGVGLGVGFFTFLTFGTFVPVAVAAFASGSPLLGALISAPFGLARTLALVPTSSTDALEDASERVPRLVNASSLALVTATALVIL